MFCRGCLRAFERRFVLASQLRIGNTLDVVTAVREFAAISEFIEGPCHASDMMVIPWLEDELVIVAAPAHPLRRPLGAERSPPNN